MAKSKEPKEKKPRKKNSGEFKPGNNFWEIRSKHGKASLFASPPKLWEAATEYVKWCRDNPFFESKPMAVQKPKGGGSSIRMVKVPVMRACTMEGLCRYLHVNTAYFRQFKLSKTGQKSDFATILRDVEELIRDSQISGAASGFLKENLVARINGLKDRTDVTTDDEKIVPITGMEIVSSAPKKAEGTA